MKVLIGSTVCLVNLISVSSFSVQPNHSKSSTGWVRTIRSTSSFSLIKSIPAEPLRYSKYDESHFDPFNVDHVHGSDEQMIFSHRASTIVSSAFLPILLGLPAVSSAAGPDWGIFEGKTGSLLHPAVMGALFLFQISTALKGFNWRRQRTMGDDISALKKQIPPLPEGAKTLQEAIDMNIDKDVSIYKAALDVERELNALTEERKALASQNNRDSHFNQGAILAFVGTLFAIEGPLNTYARAGKLFPGPHLYAGAGLVVCWAAAAACVPFMQKGSESARSLHIAANIIGMGLFAWQVTSGIPILLKVWELTKWP